MEAHFTGRYIIRMNTFDYIVEHGKAIDNYSSPVAFDSCEDEVLGNFNLSDYAGSYLDWRHPGGS